ncbi:ABC transporter substrate binding protein [Clostridioides difficile]
MSGTSTSLDTAKVKSSIEDKGYKDGDNIKIDFKMHKMICLLHKVLLTVYQEQKDLIYAISTPSAQAAYNATKDIPIIMTAVTDL